MSDYTGGCQCGAIRFKIQGSLTDSSICHCRMCQKTFGSFFAPLVGTRGAKLTWTKGQPKRFQSSNLIKRGFCADCGTPMTYEAPDGIAISTGSFDEPQRLPPKIQYGIECKLPYCDELMSLPARTSEDDFEAAEFLKSIISNQHPDYDPS